MCFHDKRQQFQFVQGSAWQDVTGGSKGAQGSWLIFKENLLNVKKKKFHCLEGEVKGASHWDSMDVQGVHRGAQHG